jgi:SulP family sulfate permease
MPRTPKFLGTKTFAKDAIAGLTLGIQSIPAAMATGVLAGVNPVYALYAVMVATPVGALATSSAFMSVQTTSAMALLIGDVPAVHAGQDTPAALSMLAILTGVIMLAFGLLKLGSLLRFVSNAVMVGFINGVALLIVLGQLPALTGYASDEANKVMAAFDTLMHPRQVEAKTLAIGLLTILLIVQLERTRLKSLGIVVAMFGASALVWLLSWDSVGQVRDIAAIADGLPRPALPLFSAIPALLVPAVSLALVGLVQGAGIGQIYVNPDGKYPDSSRDFTGQGAANIAAGLFRGMPVGGSISATALVHSAGARSRFANVYAGVTIVVALLVFSRLIAALAMPALAALLVVVGFKAIKPAEVFMVWKTGPTQRLVMTATFVATLIMPLQFAVFWGVVLSAALFIVGQSNKTTVKQWVVQPGEILPLEKDPPSRVEPGTVTVLTAYGSLFYAAAPAFERQLPQVTRETDRAVVILALRAPTELGSRLIEVIGHYSRRLRQHGSRLVLADVCNTVFAQLENTGYIDCLGRENVYRQTERVGESTVQAYEHAVAWVGEGA